MRDPAAGESPNAPRSLACGRGFIVVAGALYPREDEPISVWADRALAGDWESLVGADGGYSAAIFDARERRLGLAQDFFGMSRQVYHRRRDALWFATSTNALAVVPELELTPNPAHIAAMGMGLVRQVPDSPFQEIARPLSRSLHRFQLGRESPDVWRAPGCFPQDHQKPVISVDEAVERLNEALLRRLRRLVARDDCDSVGLWMTSGVDSRWMSAGLRKLGVAASYWTIGTPGTIDFETAQAYSRELGTVAHFGVVETLGDVIQELPETNWWLEGRVSLFHQFAGSIWEELRSEASVMLQGYFMNWMKWILANHSHRRAQRLGDGRSPSEALEAFVVGMRADARGHLAHRLYPEIEGEAERTARVVLSRAAPGIPYHLLLAMQLDGGPVERALALPRMSHAVGGADVTLMDTGIVAAALDATRIPYETRRRIQPRCITALDPLSAALPSTPLSLPPRAMTGSVARVARYAVMNPLWLPRMIHGRRSKSIYAFPIRMKLLGTPERLAWAQRFLLDGGGKIAGAFGRGAEDLLAAVQEKPKHKAVGLVWSLVSLELYLRAFSRAALGKDPAWESLSID